MTDAYRARLENYLASMLQAKRMLSLGIITPEDYAIIDTMQREEFGISSCSLYRGIDLIYIGMIDNMTMEVEWDRPRLIRKRTRT